MAYKTWKQGFAHSNPQLREFPSVDRWELLQQDLMLFLGNQPGLMVKCRTSDLEVLDLNLAGSTKFSNGSVLRQDTSETQLINQSINPFSNDKIYELFTIQKSLQMKILNSMKIGESSPKKGAIMSNFSFSHCVFKRLSLVLQICKNKD